jgi:hypothetical protein
MRIDDKIISEIRRYKSINKYITEQELPPPPADPAAAPPEGDLGAPPADPAAAPPLGDAGAAVPPPAPGAPAAGAEPQPVDVANDPDVEKVGEEKDGNKEEIEVTDLVKSQKNVETKQEEYFDNLFKHLENLESKLSEMDTIVDKLNTLEQKIEKYRVKTPEEKLELRSLDSGPFNQKLSQFFDDKMTDIEKSGKNEYVLTQDEVEDYSPMDIKKSFRAFGEEPQEDNFKRIT